ncbi:MAG: molybdopterin-dependent oxidoreductase [Deltaproteobacteria bacterium]|nr:molybdopterin-dependent oxidoreductase [Deltaproteobacteria bacterium]
MPRHLATCTLCEAACGIVVEEEDGKVVGVRGDPHDPASRGYVCPKVVGMQDLHEDPDRLRAPLIRRGASFTETTWEEALSFAAEGLRRVRAQHGRDAVAVYQGNPTAHNLGLLTVGQAVIRTLGTRNLYSASTLDQAPHMRAAHEMFGHVFYIPVPDIDRTEHLLIVGANPLVSNGSIMTAPDMKRRLSELRARGGRVVVIDPRRTETAAVADEHVFVRPGADAALLLAMIHVLFAEQRARPGLLGRHLAQIDELREAVRDFSPRAVARATGVEASRIVSLARAFAAADRAACYVRVGTCHQRHATLVSWAAWALNAITGNLDREGGSMWSTPAADLVWIADRVGASGYGRFKSRVRGLPELGGELPIACLAEEIETPGAGQIRALITSAGNPVLSAPNGRRVEAALASLEHMVSVDGYLNETTRHAHVILPPVSPLQRGHYDVLLAAFGVRNHAKYVPAALPKGAHERHDWEILLDLGLRLRLGDGALSRAPLAALRAGLGRLGPEGMLDVALRTGPYGLSLKKLAETPHGLDLGALKPRLPAILRTRDRKVHLAPKAFLAELPELRASLERADDPGELSLIGRRHLRSNNSWMHNCERLMKGRARCTLLLHPKDAARLGLADGDLAIVTSAAGSATFPVEITDEMMPGVASAPHGFGHHREGTRMHVAEAHAGTSVNDVTDDALIDRLSGNAAFSSLRVRIEAARKAAAAE